MTKPTVALMILGAAMGLTSCTTTKTVPGNSSSEQVAKDDSTHENENLIIYYDPEKGNEELLEAAKNYGSELIYVYRNINGIAVTVPKGRTMKEAMKYYEKINGVLSVSEDRKMQLQ